MKNQISQVSSFEWEINEIQDQQKKKARFLEKIIFAVFALLFIFPPLGFFVILIIIIIFINSLQSSNIKQKESIILEKYKIDENGIAIDNLKENKKRFFPWNELSSFHSYSKINPVMGFIISKIAGDDFVVVNKNNKRIKLSVGINDTSKVKYMLSRKLKFKTQTSEQAVSSLSDSIFKIKYSGIGLFDNWLSSPSSSNNNRQKNIGFVNSKQEKQFHEQTIAQHGNLQKEKEAFKKKILIVSYLIVMFIVTIIYFVYKNKDSLSGYNENIIQEKSVSKNAETQVLPQKNNSSSVHKSNNELWQDKGWPKNEIDIVRCDQDSDCELYFYFNSEPRKPIPAEIDFNRNVNIARDSQGCFWGAVNKKYKYLWWQRYPLLKNCDISIIKEEQITCHKYTKTCTLK